MDYNSTYIEQCVVAWILWSARCPPKAQKSLLADFSHKLGIGKRETSVLLGEDLGYATWGISICTTHKKMTLHFFPQSMLDPCSIFVLAVFHCIWTHFQWQWRQYDHYLTNHHGDRWNDGMAIKWDWGRRWIVMRYDVQCVIWCQSNAMNGTPCWPRVS